MLLPESRTATVPSRRGGRPRGETGDHFHLIVDGSAAAERTGRAPAGPFGPASCTRRDVLLACEWQEGPDHRIDAHEGGPHRRGAFTRMPLPLSSG